MAPVESTDLVFHCEVCDKVVPSDKARFRLKVEGDDEIVVVFCEEHAKKEA